MAEVMALAGLASSIITFIDASVKLASVSKEFYLNCGELPKELSKCQKLTDEFYLWISDLQRSLSVQNPLIQPTEADIALQNVIVNCVDECRTFQELLLGLLPTVKVRNQMGARLVALKSAVSAMHKEGKIKRLHQSLEGLKNELRLCIGERTMRLSEQALKQNERILEVGEKAINIQSEGQREIAAYMVDHRTRLEDVSNKLGWLEVDLQQTDRKSDELLLLVRELASSVNSKNDNTAIICISIPRALYNPSLSIYKGFRAYSQKLPMPGGWVPTIWDFRPFQSRDNGTPNRVAFISIGLNNIADEELEFKPKKVDSGIIFSHSQFYYQQQGWLSWLMCLEHTNTMIYPITKPKAITGRHPDNYKVWGKAMKAITYEPSSTSPVVSTPFAQVQATPDLERIEAQARSILSITGNLDVDEFYSIFPRFMHGELLGIGHDAVSRAREILKAKRNSQELKSDNQTQQIGTRQRRTIPRISSRSTFNTFLEMKHRNNRAWESAGDSTDESAVSPRPRRMSSGSYMETKALQDLEQREEEAALRQRAVSTFTASAVNESPSAAESTRIPQATFIEQITTVQDIEKEFIQLQHRRKDDISKAQEITKRLQSTGISDDTQTLEEIQAIMRIMATANANSFSTLSASNLKNLHGMITTNTSIEDSAKNPFNWGIKLVEEQDYLKLFMLQFYIGLFPLFLFEPWKFSFYITLKTGLRKILMTSRINYHGDISFLSLVVSRTIIALIPFMHVLFKHDIFGLSKYEYYQVYVYNGRNRRMIPQRRRRRGHWTLNPRWLLLMCWTMFSIAMNSIAFIAVDFTGFRFQPDFLLDLYWTLWGVSVFIFWWIIASGFRIRLGEYDISHWNVWFLLAVVFFFGDSCA